MVVVSVVDSPVMEGPTFYLLAAHLATENAAKNPPDNELFPPVVMDIIVLERWCPECSIIALAGAIVKKTR